MITAVDTNVLLDILLKDEEFLAKSKRLLQESYEKGSLIIAPEVYSELLTQFLRKHGEKGKKEIDIFLSDFGIRVKRHGEQSLFEAGSAWLEYTNKRSLNKVECPDCGEKNEVKCGKCGHIIKWREHIITDFVIGANAQEHADRILSRDEQFFKSSFDLEVVD